MNWIAAGATALALAVSLGAFGAHALRDRLDAYSLDVYQRAVFYHFIHALGLLLVSLLARTGAIPLQTGDRIAWLLLAGIALFSGSLYLLALTGARWMGAITPFGGISFIAAWVWLAWAAARQSS